MLNFPENSVPIVEIPLKKNIQLFIKREDLIHPEISGNKFWKLFYNVNHYLEKKPKSPFIITFGGAFSNHISAVSMLSKNLNIKTLGIIRGDELQSKWEENPTLKFAHQNGMSFRFVKRADYRDKIFLSEQLQQEFPQALIIPEGGSNELAVEGVKHMLTEQTKSFDYLCAAVGTGGTLAGISRFAEENQKVLGFTVVDDASLNDRVFNNSNRNNFELISAHDGGYGKITDENIRFINDFSNEFTIPLDPIYTGKMMRKIFDLINEDYFPQGAKILAFHTGGLQGIKGANEKLRQQKRTTINPID